MNLYCIGCGHSFWFERLKSIALSCSCGAYSPIFMENLEDISATSNMLPSSLFAVIMRGTDKNNPHIEYYLGFSEFTCPAKTAWEKRFREQLGMISMNECPEEKCKERYVREYTRVIARAL